MYILGIYNGHDAAAALIKDGQVLAAIQEERLNRIKHYAGLPVRSVDFCLSSAGISAKDLDYVVVPRLRDIPDIETLFGRTRSGFLSIEEQDRKGLKDLYRNALIKAASLIHIGNQFGLPSYAKKYPLGKKGEIIKVDHHLAHASSAYYNSGFNRCLVVTADGAGDALSASVWIGDNGRLEPVIKIGRNGSLGFFYNAVTEALGWQISEGEGKVMGLAPYGSTENVKGKLDFCLPVFKEGRLAKPHDFKFPKLWVDSGVYHWHMEESEIIKRLIEQYGRDNIAAEAQRCLEEQMVNFIRPHLRKLGLKKLAASGGDFLNVKMNQKIQESCDLEEFFVYPDAGDGGNPVGAAQYCYYTQTKKKYIPHTLDNIYWGSSYENDKIQYYLDLQKIKYTKLTKKELVKSVAKMLSKGKIIAWFQGKMEVGPRALGGRSILMDPRDPHSKDIINNRVKFRESFRPFTPSMTPKGAKKFVKDYRPAPFMIISYDALEEKKDQIPAVVHVDGTLRPQILERKANPLYYDLIEEFGDITGVYVLLNTSFNIKGEPIVESPRDAIKCFYDTGLDYLAVGDFLISK